MATLTTDWQYLGQAYIGKSGGSLYVRVYARYTQQDIANNRSYVQYQARAYYENGTYIQDDQGTIGVSGTGASYQSQGCTRPTTGETNTITTEGWVYHNNDGTKNISCAASINFPNWGWSNTAYGYADLPQIPRASGIACSSPNIGETAIITIDRKSTAFTNTITYNIGGITGTIAEKTTKETLSLDTSSLKEKIYALIPDDKRVAGTIYCTTYNGDTKIGDTQSTTFYLYAIEEDCKADITAEIIDTNEKVTTLTNKFIKYISKPKVTINAIPKLSSTIKAYSINLNDGQTSNLQENTFDTIGSNKVTVSAIDSRGYQNSADYELDMIDYIKLHINTISLIRPEGTSNEILLNADGVWYNGKFTEEKSNTLKGKFQYRLTDELEWTDGDELILTITDNTFKFNDYSLGNIFDYDSEYQFKIILEDEFMIVGNLSSDIITVPKGQEIVALGEDGGWIYGDWYLNDKLIEVEKNVYSTDEKIIGKYFDKDLYRKCLDIGDYTWNNGIHTFKHNIKNLDTPVNIYIKGYYEPVKKWYLNWDNLNNNNWTVDSASIYITCTSSGNDFSKVMICIEYTKKEE